MSNRVLLLLAAGLVVTGCRATPLDAVTIDPHTLLTGLVAHWTFDEGSGATVVDHSGNGHNGMLVGGTWLGAGRFGGALELALDDTVTFENFPPATPNWTVSVWLQMSETQLAANVATGDYGTILSTELACSGGWELTVRQPRTAFQIRRRVLGRRQWMHIERRWIRVERRWIHAEWRLRHRSLPVRRGQTMDPPDRGFRRRC